MVAELTPSVFPPIRHNLVMPEVVTESIGKFVVIVPSANACPIPVVKSQEGAAAFSTKFIGLAFGNLTLR